jgi:hypothetical protein
LSNSVTKSWFTWDRSFAFARLLEHEAVALDELGHLGEERLASRRAGAHPSDRHLRPGRRTITRAERDAFPDAAADNPTTSDRRAGLKSLQRGRSAVRPPEGSTMDVLHYRWATGTLRTSTPLRASSLDLHFTLPWA